MRYTIFAHQSEYHLREELAEASKEDIAGYDWQTLEYTLKEFPRAVKHMRMDMAFICIMDEKFNIHKVWKKED